MAKMANRGFSHATIELTQYLNKVPHIEVREEKQWGVEFPGHIKVNAGIERHPAILCLNHMPWCLPCQSGTGKNPRTRWRCTWTGAHPPNWHRQPTPEPNPEQTPQTTPSRPSTPLASTGNTSRAQCLEIINLLARYEYSQSSFPSAESFTLDTSTQDSEHNTDFDSDMLPDEGTSTG